ncbi:MAG: hypothetical protein HY234_04810 [Acidobacteria bacterium]|nr:hypothetical protein [Acidobacteriota bacterium]
MNFWKQSWLLTGALLIGCGLPGILLAQTKTGKPARPKANPTISSVNAEAVLWWLPPDTETLFVAQGPFRLTRATPATSLERLFEKSLQVMAMASLGGKEDDPMGKELLGAPVDLVVEGARNFRAPKNLGGMPFDGCQIVVFGREFGSRGDALMKSLEERAEKKLEIDGFRVLLNNEQLEDDLWEFYVVRPKPNVFIVSTQEGYLKETLNRINQKALARALPEDLPEWKYVDRKTRVWAVRHFDKRREESDPSSPFGGRKSANVRDEEAIGLAFSYSAVPGRIATVYYLSNNKNAVSIAKEFWSHPSDNLTPRVRQFTPGVVEVSVKLADEDVLSMLIFVLMGAFGHGVYL